MAVKEDASTQCKYYDVCGRDIDGNPADGLCILHSIDATKDARAFGEALAIHRKRHGDNFARFVFPTITNFGGTTFSEDANFFQATFSEDANFIRATFSKGANFRWAKFRKGSNFFQATFSEDAHFFQATFSKDAHFSETTFSEGAHFRWATFSEGAHFIRATFSKGAHFSWATFSEDAHFIETTFSEDAHFIETTFSEDAHFIETTFSKGAYFIRATFSKGANFSWATFSGRTLFCGRPGNAQVGHIFASTVVDFRQVVINPPDVITFLGADLTTCQFLDTDLRKVQLVNVEWPQKGGRILVYDEIASVDTEDRGRRPWSQIERLYRELKQNYEDRRDYERAGDFHYGEKEMRRRNPGTARGLRFCLTLYWLFSGYGERYLRPLLWAGLLFVGSTIGYMWWGLCPPASGPKLACDGAKLALASGWDWLQGAYYSFRVMTLLKPVDWVPVGSAHVINTFQTLFGPLFLGLFALALRQRLKR
jgi:hypothetical protein